MNSIKELFELNPNVSKKGIQHKNNLAKRQILAYMAVHGECSIATLAKHISISIPSVTKLVAELVQHGMVADNGKIVTDGGRRPSIYGLSCDAIFFVGAYAGFDGASFVLIDLHNNIVCQKTERSFAIENTQESFDTFYDLLVEFIDGVEVDRNRIIGMGISMVGRINPEKGINHSFYTFLNKPIAQIIEQRTGIKTLIENDVRSKCFVEYSMFGRRPENAIFLELGIGVAIGIIVNGELCYGNSGFAGEFGHVPFTDNDILCYCGKKGCLETEVSGKAIERKVCEKLNNGQGSKLSDQYNQTGSVSILDIVEAALADDNLAIETLIEVSDRVGRSLSFLINIFNPEIVVIGGCVARAGEHILLPIKSAMSKYSIRLVSGDTEIKISELSDDSPAIGGAMLIRKNILGI